MRYFSFKQFGVLSLILLCLLTLNPNALRAQDFQYQTYTGRSAPLGTIRFDDGSPNIEAGLVNTEKAHPAPASALTMKKKALDAQRDARMSLPNPPAKNKKNSSSFTPTYLRGFMGNATNSTPNDNDIAVSNSNTVLSVLNTNIGVFNDTGKYLFSRSLSVVAKTLTGLNRTYDPRTLYDPENDRFILVFLQGSSSQDTRICVGFSKTNDPTKDWTFYQLPGNIWGDSSWSDYPIIAMNKHDLFITVNRLKDNTYWKNGFLESVIWQVDKQQGFASDTLYQKAYYNIVYKNRPIWSICPARQGNQMQESYMNLISLRPEDDQNDTVFVHEVFGNVKSGKSELKLKVLKSPVAYGLQPNAYMPNGYKLQTNDARCLSALYVNNALYFAGNSMHFQSFSPSLFFCFIDGIWTSKPDISAQIIHHDSFDLGYPSLAYAGGGLGDKSVMLTCSYVSKTQFPGTGFYFIDRNLHLSDYVIAKQGESAIRLIGDTVERWGDYTGIQQKYNEPGVCWLTGSFGKNMNNLTWLARVKTSDPGLPVNEILSNENHLVVYPNPVQEQVDVIIHTSQTELADFILIDMKGTQIPLLCDRIKAGTNRFSFTISDLPSGIYTLQIRGRKGFSQNEKLLIQH